MKQFLLFFEFRNVFIIRKYTGKCESSQSFQGAILADAEGMGKIMTILAFLKFEKEQLIQTSDKNTFLQTIIVTNKIDKWEDTLKHFSADSFKKKISTGKNRYDLDWSELDLIFVGIDCLRRENITRVILIFLIIL